MLLLRLIARPALLATLLWLPAFAGPELQQVPEGQDIPVEDWKAMATGRTLTYRLMDGSLFAREHYHPGGNDVSLEFSDGTCIRGTWHYIAPRYCFDWEHDGSICFRHIRYGDAALIIQLTEDGQDTTMLQLMTEITDAPLACGPPLIG